MLVRWLVFVHVLSAITFFLMHGTSAAMAFAVKRETNFDRIRGMLDMSWKTLPWMFGAFALMGLTGIILPFMIHLWDRIYIWASIVLLLGSFFYTAAFNETHYKRLRRLVGLPYMKGNKEMPAEPPSKPEDVAALLQRTNTTGLVIAGYVVPAVVLWMMMFKPF